MNADHGLRLEDFRRIPWPGLDGSVTRISQAMAWYRDQLFVGTGRGPVRPLGLSPAELDRRAGLRQLLAWSEARTTPAQRAGAQIWRYHPGSGAWALVYTSPWVTGQDGTQVPRDRTVRAGAVFRGAGDRAPALYFGVGSMEGQAIVLRSRDGQQFDEAGPPGLGLGAADVPSLRTLCQLEGRLFTSPMGRNHDRGLLDDIRSDMPVVLESTDPARRGWRPVSEPGFGDPGNLSVDEMASFDGALYAGTHNPGRGYQIWKADARARRPYRWRKILEDGAFRGPPSSVPVSMLAFDGALYVGSGLEEQGRGHVDSYGPFGAELVRIYPDDSWELLVGRQRLTPHGLKRPRSGAGPGFDDPLIQAFWRMAELDGWLYLGASDWRFAPTYLPRPGRPRPELSPSQVRSLVDRTRAYAGGFGMWRSRDGVDWLPITTTGFDDNPYTYGIRQLSPTPFGLFVATASARGSLRGGGPQLWLGAARGTDPEGAR